MRFERIVVGVDGSTDSERAVEAAAAIAAGEPGCVVIAVHALGLLEDRASDWQAPNDRRGEVLALLRTEWTEGLDGLEGVRHELRDGHPVDVVLRTAEEFDAGLIVVGRRGSGSTPEGLLTLGSTSAELASRSDRAVLLVPRGRAS